MANKITNRELLARLDERSLDTWRSLDEFKKDNRDEHSVIVALLEKQNGRIRKNSIAIAFIVGSLGLGGGIVGIINLVG